MKISALIFAILAVSAAGCADLQLETSYSGKTPDKVAGKVAAEGHGSMWDFSERGVLKKERDNGIELPRGADYIGEKKNYSVCYRIGYWDSLLTVVSFGYYAPFSVEYGRTKDYQRKLETERQKGGN